MGGNEQTPDWVKREAEQYAKAHDTFRATPADAYAWLKTTFLADIQRSLPILGGTLTRTEFSDEHQAAVFGYTVPRANILALVTITSAGIVDGAEACDVAIDLDVERTSKMMKPPVHKLGPTLMAFKPGIWDQLAEHFGRIGPR